jgi:hypothetical protein
MKQTAIDVCFVLFYWLAYNPEGGGDMFLRNIDSNSSDYTVLHPRRQNRGDKHKFYI